MIGKLPKAMQQALPRRATAIACIVAIGAYGFVPSAAAANPVSPGESFASNASAMALAARAWPFSRVAASGVEGDIGRLVRSASALPPASTAEFVGAAATASSDADSLSAPAAAPYVPIVSDLLWGISNTIRGVSLWVDDWVDYGVDVATVVAGWTPGVHLFAEQIQIIYYCLLEPLVMVPILAFADFLERLDPVFMVSNIVEGYIDGIKNFLTREYWFIQSFPAPWPRFPVGLPLPPFLAALEPVTLMADANSESAGDTSSAGADAKGAPAVDAAEAAADQSSSTDPAVGSDPVAAVESVTAGDEQVAVLEDSAGADAELLSADHLVGPEILAVDTETAPGDDEAAPPADETVPGADETAEGASAVVGQDESGEEAVGAASNGDAPGAVDTPERAQNTGADLGAPSETAGDSP